MSRGTARPLAAGPEDAALADVAAATESPLAAPAALHPGSAAVREQGPVPGAAVRAAMAVAAAVAEEQAPAEAERVPAPPLVRAPNPS